MEKFNPFEHLEEHPEMSPDGLTEEELEIAKNETGVASEFERCERMIKSGDSLLVQKGLERLKKIIDGQQETIDHLESKKSEKDGIDQPPMETKTEQEKVRVDEKNFLEEIKSFGINDENLLKRIFAYGNIGSIEASPDRLEIFFPGKKNKYIIIDKIVTRKLDPQTKELIEETVSFKIDNNPRINYISSSPGKKLNQEQLEKDSSMFG